MKKINNYKPILFLSSLGMGGLSVSFFMYLMFLVPHKGVPLATFDYVFPALKKGDWLSVVSILAIVGIIFFAIQHFKLLILNIKNFNLFKKSKEYKELKEKNEEITLMAIPLTFAMTINVCFVLGAVFVPGLWGVVEYLFPMALIGFLVVGIYALKIFMNYLTRVLVNGNFDCEKNNNLSQMISIFAFAMIAVGFAAPGAMSHNITINSIGIIGSIFFLSISFLLILIKLINGFKNMFDKGISLEASPSLWIMIPILTLIGISFIRIIHGLHHNYNSHMEYSSLFILTTIILSLQVIFGMIGYQIMKKMGYFDKYINGKEKSPISFALICPGVAITVFGFFFINFGLVKNNILDKYSLFYFTLMLPFIYIQIKTIITSIKLKNKFSL